MTDTHLFDPATRGLARNRMLLTAIRGLRAFGFGYFAVVFPLYVQHFGVHATGIGLLTAFSVVLGALFTGLFSRWATRWGSRRVLILSAGLMILTGILMATATSTADLILAAVCGFLPPEGGRFFNALEEGLLGHTPSEHRTKVFAVYGLVGTAAGAIGALTAGLASLPWFPTFLTGARFLFWGLGLLGGVVLLLALAVAEPPGFAPDVPSPKRSGLHRSRGVVYTLAALFVADSLGGEMVATPLLVYWLHQHFHMSLSALAALFFGIDILAAISFPLAERLSRVLGLINTAVFTHIPFSLLLILVPFAPSGAMAAALLLARGLLVEMDVPTRQSYIASVVDPSERTAAAGVTSVGKQIGSALGLLMGGWTLAVAGATIPFVLGGTLKIGYDMSLWFSFRKVKSER